MQKVAKELLGMAAWPEVAARLSAQVCVCVCVLMCVCVCLCVCLRTWAGGCRVLRCEVGDCLQYGMGRVGQNYMYNIYTVYAQLLGKSPYIQS